MNIDILATALFSVGGAAFLTAAGRVITSFRHGTASSEAKFIKDLLARIDDAEQRLAAERSHAEQRVAAERARAERYAAELDDARERATRYRLLAVAKQATRDELDEAEGHGRPRQ